MKNLDEIWKIEIKNKNLIQSKIKNQKSKIKNQKSKIINEKLKLKIKSIL
jgi:hypothetical protein